MANAIGLSALTVLFWSGVAVLSPAAISTIAWASLYGLCVVVSITLWSYGPGRAKSRDWLWAAVYAVLLATFCYGVNSGLDVLYGVHRHRAHPEELLGGLELWFILCPGVVAIAMAGATRSLMVGRLPLAP